MEWEDYVNEVRTKGFDKASPLARLIWSCEVGQIDQHASVDLMAIAETIEALKAERDEARQIVIEADVLSQVDGKPRSYEEAALAVVYVMSCGVQAMNEEGR